MPRMHFGRANRMNHFQYKGIELYRPRAAEVMVKGDKFEVVRERETFEELIKGEHVPSFL